MKEEYLEKEILEVTAKLISFRSTEDRVFEMQACLDYIKEYFMGSGVLITEWVYKEKPSLIISFKKKRKFGLILNGHIDVIEGNESLFTLQKNKNMLYGRGTCDMKAAVAVMMVLMKNLSKTKKKPNLALMIVSDEETGGEYGTQYLLRKYRSHFAIIGESTNLHVQTRHKGSMQVKLTAYGSSSHGSKPWIGCNAIEKLMKQYYKLISELDLATSKKKWKVSINPTNFMATSPYNVTPSKAEMIVDFRTTEDITNKKILSLLKKQKIKYKVIINRGMLFTSVKNPYVRELKKIMQRNTSRRVKYQKGCASSDGKFFTAKGIPVVNFGPRGANLHRSNEFVKKDSLLLYYNVLDKFIRKIF